MQYSFVTHARHCVVSNYFPTYLVKIRIKSEYDRITLKKAQKFVSVTGNPYHVACLYMKCAELLVPLLNPWANPHSFFIRSVCLFFFINLLQHSKCSEQMCMFFFAAAAANGQP